VDVQNTFNCGLIRLSAIGPPEVTVMRTTLLHLAAAAMMVAALPTAAEDPPAISGSIAAPTAPPIPAPPPTRPATAPAAVTAVRSPWLLGVFGVLPTGAFFDTAIIPREATVQGGGWDQAWGFGIAAEYRLAPTFRVFFDGAMYQQKRLVANAGSYGTSFWVYEQSGYTSHEIGPFGEDAYYYTDTNAVRLGAKYALPLGSLSPWIGASFGAYRWTATYGNGDRSGKWGQDTGVATGLTYMLGADLALGKSASIGFFADLASPVARIEMEDLFRDGWTWTVSENQHVVAPYRFGIMLSMTP
jgi:hypothetical protein